MKLKIPLSETISLCIFLSFFFCGYAHGNSQADNSFTLLLQKKAQEAEQKQNYLEAIQEYQQVLQMQPSLLEVRTKLGLLKYLTEDYPSALKDFQLVLQSTPQNYVPNLFAGYALVKLERPQEAIQYLLRAQRLQPKDIQPALGLGQAYAALRQFAKANAEYYQAWLNSPHDSEAYYGLGITYLSVSRTASERVRQIDAKAPLATSLLVEALMEQGNVDRAIQPLHTLVGSHSLPECVCDFPGIAHIRQDDFLAAKMEFARSTEQYPGCLESRLGLALLYLREKKVDRMSTEVDGIARIDPVFLKANLASMWPQFKSEDLKNMFHTLSEAASVMDSNKYSVLIWSLKRWLSDDVNFYATDARIERSHHSTVALHTKLLPTSAAQLLAQGRFSACESRLQNKGTLKNEDKLRLAECAFRVGDYRTTYVASTSVLTVLPNSLPGLYWQARSSSRLAIEALQTAVLMNASSTRAHLLLAETLREKQDYRRSESEYLKALDVDPGFTPARLGLAILYWDISEFDKSLAALKVVLHKTPQDPDANYMVAAILVQRHEFEDALPYLRNTSQGREEIIAKSHALRSRIYAAQGHAEAAITELQQILDKDSDGTYHYQLARLYKKLGNDDAASKALQQFKVIRQNNSRNPQ